MSSILKALKKIETETSPFAGFQLNETQIDPRKIITTRVKRVRLIRKISSFLCIALMMAACGWVWVRYYPWMSVNLFSRKPPEITPASLKVDKTNPKKPMVPPPEAKPTPLAAAGVTKAENQISQASKPELPNPSKSTPPSTSHPKPEHAITTTKGRSPKSNFTIANAAPVLTEPQREHRSAADEKPALIQSRDDSKFSLQAIAWSAKAHQRMAVINGRILREGESLDGFLVTHIHADEVILSDGGTSWRIEFRLKTPRSPE